MASWFRRDSDVHDVDESTDQIAARVIADAAGQRPSAPPPDAVPPPPTEVHRLATPEVDADPEAKRLRAERGTLIELCLYALDRARSGGVVERLEEGLAGVGVTASRPDGEPFDPAVHEAGDTVPTGDAGLDGTVAETEVVGFSDGERLLRPPIVIVYAVREESAP